MTSPQPRYPFDAEVPTVEELGRVHVIAIGGAGMSAVARLLLARGVQVSGSDRADSGTLEALRDLGATVWLGHDPSHVAGADTVVVSSAVPDDNPELADARERGVRVLHRAQALAAVTRDRTRIAIAGANGKTTTTSMVTVALAGVGRDPVYACGGEIAQLGSNAAWGSGPEAVIEADESDGSFIVYAPDIAVVTSVQPDHLDYYGTEDEVRRSYRRFAGTIQPGGLLIACADDPGAAALAGQMREQGIRVVTYGRGVEADLRLDPSSVDGLSTQTPFRWMGVSATLSLRVPGAHNVENAAAAFLVLCAGLGLAPEGVLDALATFTGARRRFEVRGQVGGVSVIDDYAHNAPKVAALVRTARALAPESKVRVIFQPHLFSRTRDFADGFADGLAPADVVVLLDIYGAREAPIPGVSSALIARRLSALPGERDVELALAGDAAIRSALKGVGSGDLVLIVGAGDVTGLVPRVVEMLGQAMGEAR